MATQVGATGITVSERIVFQEVVIALMDGLKAAISEGLNFRESLELQKFPPIDISIIENINFSEGMIEQVLYYATPGTFKREFILDDKKTWFEIPERKSAFVLPEGEEI